MERSGLCLNGASVQLSRVFLEQGRCSRFRGPARRNEQLVHHRGNAMRGAGNYDWRWRDGDVRRREHRRQRCGHRRHRGLHDAAAIPASLRWSQAAGRRAMPQLRWCDVVDCRERVRDGVALYDLLAGASGRRRGDGFGLLRCWMRGYSPTAAWTRWRGGGSLRRCRARWWLICRSRCRRHMRACSESSAAAYNIVAAACPRSGSALGTRRAPAMDLRVLQRTSVLCASLAVCAIAALGANE